jgi:hypothetical protein
LSILKLGSALAELRCATCGFEAVLFTFFHSWVTGKETCGLESWTVCFVNLEESTSDAVANCACLAGKTAAGNGGFDVYLAGETGGLKWLANDELKGIKTEILIKALAVDGDCAGAVREKVNSGNRGLSTAGAVHIRLLASIHVHLPPYS